MKNAKSIFEYDNYRNFLKDYYCREKKKAPHRFSYRYFSQRAGISTSNFLLLVMQGKRNLTHESASKFGKAIALNKRETEYFQHLVSYNQTNDPEERILHYKKILSFREYRSARQLTKDHVEYFTKWYYPAIRELVNVEGFEANPEWICARLRHKVKPCQASEALGLLQKLGLIGHDPSGKWVQVDKHVISDGGAHSMALVMFHQEMIRLGAKSLKEHSSQRDISSLTMSISRGQFEKIKERIARFKNEIREVVAGDGSSGKVDRVCQLNFQLFHLAEAKEGRGDL